MKCQRRSKQLRPDRTARRPTSPIHKDKADGGNRNGAQPLISQLRPYQPNSGQGGNPKPEPTAEHGLGKRINEFLSRNGRETDRNGGSE